MALPFRNIFFVFNFVYVLGDISSFYGGYSYPHPPNPPPVSLDEPSPSPPIYIPPIFSDEPTPVTPSNDYLPPVPTSGYLPPVNNDIFPPPLPPLVSNDDSVVVPALSPSDTAPYPPSSSYLPPQFRMDHLSCVHGSRFRAIFRMDGYSQQYPVVEDATGECIEHIGRNKYKMEMNSFEALVKCGVKRCARNLLKAAEEKGNGNMCAMIRIPAIRGLRLPEDKLVTLMCTPQERMISKTSHVKLGSNKIFAGVRARSNPDVVASGGSQNDLKTRITIYRKRPGTNVFDQPVQSNAIIHLGEDLLLKASVNDGDGWKYSDIGPVVITGLQSQKSALLVNENGCRNSLMKSVCPNQPHRISPLTTDLQFRAFLFQESPEGDEMVVSVKMQGCIHPEDCSKSTRCNDKIEGRSKRSASIFHEKTPKNSSGEVEDWESRLVFRVEPYISRDKLKNTRTVVVKDETYLYIVLAALCLSVLGLIVLTYRLCTRQNKL
ncbi:uncharacterized protein LOC143202763 [Rhynchophorus ferrugineus]|uniref:uncharacterized protein LOC143202763 n=1 Tax=Rhynchophorus ferrugineus TaxID=354439 RepID=UPI003FCCD400